MQEGEKVRGRKQRPCRARARRAESFRFEFFLRELETRFAATSMSSPGFYTLVTTRTQLNPRSDQQAIESLGRQPSLDSHHNSQFRVSVPQVEVLNVDVLVGRRLALAPQQQALLGRHFLNGNVLDGEAQNDGPDHAEGHFCVAVHDF